VTPSRKSPRPSGFPRRMRFISNCPWWQWRVLSSTANPLTAGLLLDAVCNFLFGIFGNVVWTNIYELDGTGSDLGSSKRFISASNFWPALGPTQPPIRWVSDVFFPGLQWPGSEAGHSPPSGAKVKNEWSCTSIPPVYLHGVYIDGFTVLLIFWKGTEETVVRRLFRTPVIWIAG